MRRIVPAAVLLMLASTPAWADRVAVVAVGPCGIEAQRLAQQVRQRLAQQLDIEVLDEAATAAPLGGLPRSSLAAAEALLTSARDAFYQQDLPGSRQRLDAAEEALEDLPPSADRWRDLREVHTFKAWVALKASDPAAATREILSILRVEPDYVPDPHAFPPAVEQLASDARLASRLEPTADLAVVSQPAGLRVDIDGCDVGRTPLSIRLPPATYRVELDLGARRTRAHAVRVDGPTQLELDPAFEQSLHPEAGPCIDLPEDPAASRTAASTIAALLGVNRLIAVGLVPSENDVASLGVIDAESGQVLHQAFCPLAQGLLSPEATEATADLVTRAEVRPPLRSEAREPPVAPPLAPQPPAVAGVGPVQERRTTPSLRLGAYALGGLGVAAAAIATGALLDRSSALGSLQSFEAPGGQIYLPGSQGSVGPLLSRADRDAQLAEGLGIGAGVALATATALWLLSPSSGSEPGKAPASGGPLSAGLTGSAASF